MALILYGEPYWYSPYVFTVFVALREKEIPFELQTLELSRGEQKGDAFRQAITGRVPAIDHDGFWLAESSAIVEYLEEAFPGPRLLPEDPQERARARQIMHWIRSDLLALREERSTQTMFYGGKQPLTAAGRAAAEKLIAVATQVIRPGAPDLFGRWSLADADLAFVLHRLILNEEPVPETIRRWAEAQWRRPSVQAFVSHARPAVPPPPY
jgi:glutathione S-transferase